MTDRARPAGGRVVALLGLLALFAVESVIAEPVSLRFTPPRSKVDAFAREISAEVTSPSGTTVVLPAFFSGKDTWEVRARAVEAGTYRLGNVTEFDHGAARRIEVRPRNAGAAIAKTATLRRPVYRRAGDPTRFAFSDGEVYTPIGANLAWAPTDRVTWHVDALQQFRRQQLNWTRIWMCHWGGTNLDWLPADMGRSPKPGTLDHRVAAAWDRILAAAETNGVYAQVVLQHHGQYTTGANPNWAENPWNAANRGGFLKTPGEFFTSARAIELTKRKYRYIIARWSHSPAVLAWELFNEVHWTDAYAIDRDEVSIAAWHTMMADYIRSIDPYHHLVTTSTDDLRSPIYAAMDYFQPHLYAVEMLTSTRRFGRPFESLDRPVFYGEIGDDKMRISAEEKAAGTQLVPQVWAGIMSASPNPAQTWLGESLLATRRLGELGAVARFLDATDMATREGLFPFSPGVVSGALIRSTITPGHEWERHVAPEVTLPLDGSDPLGAADIPGFLVGAPESIADGYPASTTLRLALAHDCQASVTFADAGARGAIATVLVDGIEAGAHRWPRLPGAAATGPQPPDTPPRPAELSVFIPAGARAVTIANTGGADWVRLGSVDLQMSTPVLTAAGKRSDAFIALWVWNRLGVHAVTPAEPSSASLLLRDIPAGAWQVTWWDTLAGTPGNAARIDHAGGTLRLTTPPVSRHAAVVLIRDR